MLNLSTTTLRIGSVCYNIMPLFTRIVTEALPGSWTQHAMKTWTRDQLRGPNQEFICWAAPRASTVAPEPRARPFCPVAVAGRLEGLGANG